MRALAVGRKNWLHIGSQEAGPKIAAILSVMETCKRLQINLRKYLNDVLPKLPSWSINDVAALSPLTGNPLVRPLKILRPDAAGIQPAYLALPARIQLSLALARLKTWVAEICTLRRLLPFAYGMMRRCFRRVSLAKSTSAPVRF
jgi:IS66 C-terminal element